MSDLSLPSSATAFSAGNSEKFLLFELRTQQKALLPAVQLAEVLKIPLDQIIPIPHMPIWTMGVYNWRGKILWMMDLGKLLGFNAWSEQNLNLSNYRALVLRANLNSNTASEERQFLGLVINQVEDIVKDISAQIKSPLLAAGNAQLRPFLRGYWSLSEKEMLPVLESDAIVAEISKLSGTSTNSK